MNDERPTVADGSDSWEADIAGLLNDLAGVQRDLLDLLSHKRGLLAAGDSEGLTGVADREQDLIARLQACHDRRSRLLQQAAAQGLPADSIRSLSGALPAKVATACGLTSSMHSIARAFFSTSVLPTGC